MTTTELFLALRDAGTIADVEAALERFEADHEITWTPFGRENNRGTVEVSADPGRSLVERLTNGIDAVLEAAHDSHHGLPECRTPREAARAWLDVPAGGLSAMPQRARRELAEKITIRVEEGDGRPQRVIEVRDRGTGLTAAQMPSTILSLNESNKTRKHYVAGAYGQGGSSTLAVSKYTLIASRPAGHPMIGFTVARFYEPPQEEDKLGRYVYLTIGGVVPEVDIDETEFPPGTAIRHFGYDLSNYPSPVGATSVYGLLNRTLFDPILPVWLDNPVNLQRRVIKGSRNALNGAVDEGDDERRGVMLSHRMPMFHSTLGEFGRIGIEYWVLEPPTSTNKRPTNAFVNPTKPIILTLNGQNHAELGLSHIRKDAELPFLTQRLICHIDCNSLLPGAKRLLFVSNREDARKGEVLKLITGELIRALRSDDELTRLNNEARERSMRDGDESAVREMRREVSRLLRIQGLSIGEPTGGETGPEPGSERPTHPRPPRPPRPPEPIELREPPTYIRFLWEENDPIDFHPEQRRFLRIQTDANNWYHNAGDPNASRINIVVLGTDVASRGSTSLQGGRMRAIFEAPNTATPGETGTVRVELMRVGMPMLTDERVFRIRHAPPVTPSQRQVTVPPFEVRAVSGPDHPTWTSLGWPDNPALVASTAEMEDGTLVIYYSEVFPKFAGVRAGLEHRDAALGRSFTKRYEVWLAVHSLLFFQDEQQRAVAQEAGHVEESEEAANERERQERCRIATLSAMFAEREARQPASTVVDD